MKIYQVMLLLVVALASGCATPPSKVNRDPNYSAARPVPNTASTQNPGGLYQPGSGSLYTDSKAYRVGDILTVTLDESTQASKSADTSTSKTTEIDNNNPNVLGRDASIPTPGSGSAGTFDYEVSNSSEFEGSGESNQSNSLSGSITVSVVEVLANGYLVIRGEKIISLNQGDEYIRISGIVRPEDISADNTVPSEKIANVQISYGGTGALADANRKGWLTEFLEKIWPF
jgi:flagellar L-ring protein precursor FlgH